MSRIRVVYEFFLKKETNLDAVWMEFKETMDYVILPGNKRATFL